MLSGFHNPLKPFGQHIVSRLLQLKCRFLLCCVLFSILLSIPLCAHAERLTLLFGPYMYHFNPKPEYNKYPWFSGIEWEAREKWELGGAYFQNSFDQPSGYLYGGKRWNKNAGQNQLYFKLTAGVLLGDVDPHDRAIPLNWNGIGVGVIPVFGYQRQRVSTQIAVLGFSGVMFMFGYDLME